MNRYDGMFILDVQGKDEGLKELLDQIEKEITTLGGRVHGSQKMDRRKFERVSDKLESGFYVNINFELDPAKVQTLQGKLKLNALVFRQFFLRKEAELQPA
jgi:small subunit ribosomal protein S6